MLAVFSLSSCGDDNIDLTSQINSNNDIKKTNSKQNIFDESIAIISRGVKEDKENPGKYFILLELKNFSSENILLDNYNIDRIVYTDKGDYNDQFENDGIYTSVESFHFENETETLEKLMTYSIINISENFKYNKELEAYLSLSNEEDKYITNGGGGEASFGCKVRTAVCPETSWWNDCWFGSPCTCVEFYDCEFKIKVKW